MDENKVQSFRNLTLSRYILFPAHKVTMSVFNFAPMTISDNTSAPGCHRGRDGGFKQSVQQGMYQDDLLRILTHDSVQLATDIVIYAERGDLSGLKSLHLNHASTSEDLVSSHGLHGYTPLHHACNRGHVHIVAELLLCHARINSKNDNGETPLHLAVYAGNILIVDQLIDNGADIDEANSDGETALFYAARRSQPAIVRLLLQRGADAYAVDKYGDSAVEHCADNHTRQAFQSKAIEQSSPLLYKDLLHIYSSLKVADVLKCACVSSKWHRVSEYEVSMPSGEQSSLMTCCMLCTV